MLPSTTVTAACRKIFNSVSQDPSTKEAMQTAFHAQSTFLHVMFNKRCPGTLCSNDNNVPKLIFTFLDSMRIIPCLRCTLNKPSHVKLTSSVVCSCRNHSRDYICRGRLKTEQHYASDHHDVIWGPSVGTVPILVWYHIGHHSTTTVMTSSLADVCTVHGDLHSSVL
jgi:hypothetical protein